MSLPAARAWAVGQEIPAARTRSDADICRFSSSSGTRCRTVSGAIAAPCPPLMPPVYAHPGCLSSRSYTPGIDRLPYRAYTLHVNPRPGGATAEQVFARMEPMNPCMCGALDCETCRPGSDLNQAEEAAIATAAEPARALLASGK